MLWIFKTIHAGELSSTISTPVDALAILNDVYLGYSILLVTASLQLVPIELSFRVDPALLPTSAETTETIPSTSRGLNTSPPAYLSLLDSPFVIPPPLDRRGGIPALPRVAIKPPSNLSKGDLTVTPASLRFLGTTVESFRTEIRALVSAADVVQHRLELQMKELSRQLGKLKDLADLANPVQRKLGVSVSTIEVNSEHLTTRIVRVKKEQENLLRRADKILQRLMEEHQPLISTFEKRWFEELSRLEGEIFGGSNSASISKRVERVEGQIEMLRPDLEILRQKEGGDGKAAERERNRQLGTAQMRKFESLLSDESVSLSLFDLTKGILIS